MRFGLMHPNLKLRDLFAITKRQPLVQTIPMTWGLNHHIRQCCGHGFVASMVAYTLVGRGSQFMRGLGCSHLLLVFKLLKP